MSRTLLGSFARAAAVAGLCLGGMLSPIPAAQAAPPGAPTGLTDSQPNVTTTLLSWNPATDAAKYEVVLDNTADFSSPLVRQTTTNSAFVPKDDLPDGGVFWRVRAINSSNESSDWSFDQFVQGRVSTPPLVSPADGQPLAAGATPLLTWGLVSGATDFKVEVSRESSFTPANTQTFVTQSTSVVPPKTLDKGLWFWRVTASRAGGLSSDPSSARTFTVPTLPTPSLVSPPNAGAQAIEDVVLSWQPVAGAEKYEIDMSRDKDFPSAGNGVMNGPDWITMPRATSVGTRYAPMPTLDNAVTWYWRVRAVDFDGNRSDWQTTPFVFRRAWGDVSDGVDDSADLQDIPTLITPAAAGPELISGPFGFTWTAAQHASDYEINVGTDPAWSPSTFTRCRVHGTSYTPYQFRYDLIGGRVSTSPDDVCVPSPGRINYWRVRALDRPFSKSGVLPGVQGEFSTTEAFTWDPSAVTNISPTGGASVPTPTVSWDPVTGAETYKVEITDGAGITFKATTHSTSVTVRNRPTTISNPYTWTLRALDAAGNPVSAVYSSPSMNFNLVPAADQVAWENLTSSAPTLRAPGFRWAPITGADHYRVRVRREGEGWMPGSTRNLFETDLDFPAMTDISDDLFAPGAYRWGVTAYTKAGVAIGAPSPEWDFTISPLGAVTGQEIALDVQALGTTQTCDARLDPNGVDGPRCTPVPTSPVLSWARVPGASLYQVWVNTDASFTTLMEPEGSFAATSSVMYVPNLSSQVAAYPDNDAAGPSSAYYWAIVPCKSVTSCAPSVRGNLGNATNAFVKKSLPVVVNGPGRPADAVDAATATFDATDISFEWEDYLRTNRAVGASATVTGEKSTQSAMQYRIEIAADLNFTDILESNLVDQATYTSAASLYPEGPLYWRVRAVDGDDNELTWSKPWRINKRNPLPQLEQPAEGAWVSPTAPLRWAAMPAVDGYQVEVYKNNQVSPANLVCSAPANKPARYPALACAKPFAPTKADDPNDQYRWRIRRIDSSGFANPWSTEHTFEVSASTLELTAPAPGSAQIPNGPVLTWGPVPGAAEYRVDLRNESTGQNFTPVTTQATAYALTTTLTTGTYRWTVTAFDAAGGAVATQSSSFAVDAGLSATTATVISAPEGSAVGKVLTSTPPTWNQAGVVNAYQWLRNGAAITGATSPTYTLTVADYTKVISLRVSGKKTGYTDGVSVSNAIAVTAGGALQNVQVPTISGSAAPGGTLKATPGSWAPAATKFRYQWLRTGSPIPGATSASYRVTTDDAGRDVSVTVFASSEGFNEGAATAAAVAVARLASTTTGTLKASRVKVGKRAKLTVNVSVSGLTTPTGVIQVLDKGKKIAQFTMAPVHQGKKTLKLRKLPKGKHKLQVIYLGNAQTYGSKSKRIVLYVVK